MHIYISVGAVSFMRDGGFRYYFLWSILSLYFFSLLTCNLDECGNIHK